jgi:hypothetical protein
MSQYEISEQTRPFGGKFGTAILLLTLAAQVILFALLFKHEPGEKLGFGFGSLLIILLSPVAGLGMLPAMLISMVRAISAITKLNTDEDAKRQSAFYLAITLMPFVFYWFLQQQATVAH